MPQEITECPICEATLFAARLTNSRRPLVELDCPRCSRFTINPMYIDEIAKYLKQFSYHRHLISGYLRNHPLGTPVTSQEDLYRITDEARLLAPSTPLEAMDRLLLYFGSVTLYAGDVLKFDPRDSYPVVYCRNNEECYYLLRALFKRGFLHGEEHEFFVTPEGWERIEELKKLQPDSNQAFVAMWFDKEVEDAWDKGMQPALEECGYKPLRIDMQEHNEKICDRIIAAIRRSGLLVADFTGHRGGVYFEAGFAMGLGIPVIWTCRDSDIEQAHFDTRQYNHIVWKTPEELRKKLVNRIQATCPLDETGKRMQEVDDG